MIMHGLPVSEAIILLASGLTPKAAPAPYQGDAGQREVMGAAPRYPRSVRLRHPRGPVFTVGRKHESRLVIDKIAIDVTYDSDLERRGKLIKQIGLELQKNPEFAPADYRVAEDAGVDELGDYVVTIRAKMMSVPGEQFVIRRKACA
jgi:hypothetical protein